MRITHSLALGAVLAIVPCATASALSWAPGALPNGNQNSCANCHTNPRGGGPRNEFGRFAASSGAMNLRARTIDWSLLFDTDSDGDGYTNGEEMGDPDGDGTTIDGWSASLPGSAGDTPCGSGTLEGREECDGAALADATCVSLGEEDGTLGCSSTCEYDVSGCGGGGEDAGTPDAGGEDAGTPDDAGVDAGAGDAEGGDTTGAPSDAGVTESDAGGGGDVSATPDTSVPTDDSTGGTDDGGCSAARGGSRWGMALAMLALAATLPSRRRM